MKSKRRHVKLVSYQSQQFIIILWLCSSGFEMNLNNDRRPLVILFYFLERARQVIRANKNWLAMVDGYGEPVDALTL